MKIVSFDAPFVSILWQYVNQDIPHYYFYAFDSKHNKEKTEIFLVLRNKDLMECARTP